MSAQEFIKEVWGLQGTAYVVLGLRYYSRIKTAGWTGLAWDDLCMLLATFTYTAESVAAYMVVAYWQGYANNAMTDEQRAALDPASEEYTLRVNGSKTHVVGLLLYTTLLWLLKACWVFYYTRLTEGIASAKRLVFLSIFVMSASYISCLLVAFFKCIPFDHQWQIYPDPGNNCMPAVSRLQTIWVMIMNSVTDVYLMAIPLPMIWKAQLPWKKKASIMIMFSGGFLEMVFGILRCYSILTVGDSDPAQSGYWSVRESFVSFVLTNLPVVYPLIKAVFDKSRTTLSKSTNTTGAKSGLASHGGAYRLDSYPGHNKRGGDLETASKENIVPHDQIRYGGDDDDVDMDMMMKKQQHGVTSVVYPMHPGGNGGNKNRNNNNNNNNSLADDQASQDSADLIINHHAQTPRSPSDAHHHVTVMADHKKSAAMRKQMFSHQEPGSNHGTGIVVTREYEFSVSGTKGRQ